MTDPFTFDLDNAPPAVRAAGGTVREASRASFPVLRGMAAFLLELEPGALRIPHWHPNASELDYVVSGRATIGLGAPDDASPLARTFEVSAGQLAWLPQGWFHYIRNASDTEPLKMLIVFTDESPEDIGISRGFQATPDDVLGQTFGVDPSTFARLDREVGFIAPP